MKKAPKNKPFAQGDVKFVPLEILNCWKNLKKQELPKQIENNMLIVTHSETLHHHAFTGNDIDYVSLFETENPAISIMKVDKEVELKHFREDYQHESIVFPAGEFVVIRQREEGPDGYSRLVQD